MNIFNVVKMNRPSVNNFDLTHDVKLTCDMGELVPILALETVPGDRFNIDCEALIRFAPLIAPVMHRFDVSIHYFFVPNRILWPNWERFITQNPNVPTPEFPYVQLNVNQQADQHKLDDYLGLPRNTNPLTAPKVSAVPYAAYQCIWHEYYRDQNLQPGFGDPPLYLNDGNNNNSNMRALRYRCWEHDYFTSCLPFAQKGPAVDIPIGDVSLTPGWQTSPDTPAFVDGSGNTPSGSLTSDSVGGGEVSVSGTTVAYDPRGTLEVGATNINDLRRAFRLQEFFEKQARGGTRYIEQILSHFGVKSSDARMNRPEYITGIKNPVVISEVLQTSNTNAVTPQANMAGHGVSVVGGNRSFYRCEEHGYIMGILSVMPKTAYQQGIPRTFLKNDPFDFYWPSFANIGEQEVQNQEIYAFQGTADTATFGYIPRYSEYKYVPNRVAGDFRTTLDYWHAGRKFANAPQLNADFVQMKPEDASRIFAVTASGVDSLYCTVLNKISAIRPMPKFGVPTF